MQLSYKNAAEAAFFHKARMNASSRHERNAADFLLWTLKRTSNSRCYSWYFSKALITKQAWSNESKLQQNKEKATAMSEMLQQVERFKLVATTLSLKTQEQKAIIAKRTSTSFLKALNNIQVSYKSIINRSDLQSKAKRNPYSRVAGKDFDNNGADECLSVVFFPSL